MIDLNVSPCRGCAKEARVTCREKCKILNAWQKEAREYTPPISYGFQYAALGDNTGGNTLLKSSPERPNAPGRLA